jgi:alkanesulfonate monooxygenase SsuD/methylene tetrahydromethanopterin reductase-like flavin-dependent oxidoreductase (luciferase family)
MAVDVGSMSVSVVPRETRRETIQHLARRADEWGYGGFALPETWSYDTTVLLAEAAGYTQQVRLAAFVLNVWSRSAATLAMASATLDAISGGRFVLGLGAGSRRLAEGFHDVPFSAPSTRVRQAIAQVRALLRGERTPFYRTASDSPVALGLAPRPDLPIYLGAMTPPSIELAGELCDGWIPYFHPRDHLAEGIALLEQGAARAAERRPAPKVWVSVPTVVAEETAAARKGAAWFVAFYMTAMGGLVRNTLARAGYAKEADAVLAANAGREPAIVPPEAEVLLEQLTIYGTPAEVREQSERWRAAGATTLGLLLLPNLSHEAIDFTLAAFRST